MEELASFILKGRNKLDMKKCKSCGVYTFKEECPECKGKTVNPHPAKFSPEDPYGKYRRKLKRKTMDLCSSDV